MNEWKKLLDISEWWNGKKIEKQGSGENYIYWFDTIRMAWYEGKGNYIIIDRVTNGFITDDMERKIWREYVEPKSEKIYYHKFWVKSYDYVDLGWILMDLRSEHMWKELELLLQGTTIPVSVDNEQFLKE